MNNVKNFIDQWRGRGYEKGEMQPFWLSFLRDVLGTEKPENFIRFEVPVKLKHTGFIDAFLPDTKVIIEQKSLTENIEQGKAQSDGSNLTPYQQAQRYGSSLPYSMRPRWIVVCNFAQFLIYDMETLAVPTKILLSELPEKFHAFDFLVDHTKTKLRVELELSLKAGHIVGKLYDALHDQYINPDSENSLVSLNKLCVRLVFCLYAESAGIFGKHKIFREYLSREHNIRRALIDLFDVLNTPIELRDPYLDDTLKIFPYVNGGLFCGEIEIPNFTTEIRKLLLEEASSGFNWAGISQTIFGAVFESTLNPITRRAEGMHYTSLENIHKVIDPLFLDDLRGELQTIKQSARNRKKNLIEFQDKLAQIKIFDPACGSGNFLTESYLSLRRLENEVLKQLLGSQIQLGELDNPIKVSIAQFFGIEINDFAVAVAQTALWIAELQMMQETQEIIHRDLDFLPLKSYANIHEANALRVDWKTVALQVDYIIGNPPFVGRRYRSAEQHAEVAKFFDYKDVDYVACWYHLAAKFIKGTTTKVAFVSTNSIIQGEQVTPIWRKIFNEYGVKIIFAHRPFKWTSESANLAAVHCVIIGFANVNVPVKRIFDNGTVTIADNINPYLLDAPIIFIEKRKRHYQADVPHICNGNVPLDGNALKIEAADYEDFIRREPNAKKFIKRLIGGRELIYNELRYVLWLVDASPNELRKMPLVMNRIKLCRQNRLAMKDKTTRKLAQSPTTFRDTLNPAHYIALPMISSERRQYIPMSYFDGDTIPTNQVQIIPDATLYHFGVLTSSIHMAWVRTVCGRLEMRYRYSATIVYNNFPWCEPTDEQRRAIEGTAKKILDVRDAYPNATLADLYDPLTMPADLQRAHRDNDRAVAVAYGFENLLNDESAIVAELMKLYTGPD